MQIADAGTVLAEAPVSDYNDVVVPATVSEDATVAVLDLNGPIKRTVSVASVKAPVKAGDEVGVVTYRQAGRVIATVKLVASNDVAKPNPFQAAWIAVQRVWGRIFG
jgi:D-alanyl-D-alanine carboxypeptidase